MDAAERENAMEFLRQLFLGYNPLKNSGVK